MLVGFSGTGKSHVGRELARRLGRPFVDTDQRLVERFGMPIGDNKIRMVTHYGITADDAREAVRLAERVLPVPALR